ncbi:MAG: hypothetical protein ACO1SX_19380 [Actinomycetota bacterium]
MKRFLALGLLMVGLCGQSGAGAPEKASLLLESKAASLRIDLAGGVLADFHLSGDAVNPLRGMGHFLCLDRWGPPSEAEAGNGMPFHGEASKVVWRVTRPPERREGGVEAEMTAELPLAGLVVKRSIRVSDASALVVVQEEVTNRNKLGRIFNMVQHPTIGPPFLDAETRVDAGAGRGFMQSSPLPNPERPEVRWPDALHQGKRVDLRRLTDNPDPNVVSFESLGAQGWTTATAPAQQPLIGYVWQSAEYPWFNAWRHVENGKPALRGLEFGTTGLHQPFPVLVAKGRIFDLPLYTYLDAGESKTRSYALFLARTPSGFEGVKSVARKDGQLVIQERAGPGRRLSIAADRLFE